MSNAIMFFILANGRFDSIQIVKFRGKGDKEWSDRTPQVLPKNKLLALGPILIRESTTTPMLPAAVIQQPQSWLPADIWLLYNSNQEIVVLALEKTSKCPQTSRPPTLFGGKPPLLYRPNEAPPWTTTSPINKQMISTDPQASRTSMHPRRSRRKYEYSPLRPPHPPLHTSPQQLGQMPIR